MFRTAQVLRDQRPSGTKADAFQLAKIEFFSQRDIVVVKLSRTLLLIRGRVGLCRCVFTKPGARFAQMLRTAQMLWNQCPSRANGHGHQILKVQLFLQWIVLKVVELLLRILLFGFHSHVVLLPLACER